MRLPAFVALAVAICCLPATAAGPDPEPPAKWEYRAVGFTGDEKVGSRKLNDLAADGWEYVGPLSSGTVAFRRLRSGLLHTFDHPSDTVTGVAFAPDGKRVLSAGDQVRVFDVGTGRLVRVLEHPHARSAAFTPDGKRVVSAGGNVDRAVRVWDLDTGAEVDHFQGAFETGLGGIAVSSDGKRVLFHSSTDKLARLLELETGKELQRFEGHTDAVHATALSPDGKRSLTGAVDGTVRLWDNDTGKELKRLEGHKDEVWCVAFLPEGKHAVSGGKEREAIVWDLESGKEVRRLDGTAQGVHGVAVSRDGHWIACAGWGDGSICVFEVGTGKEVCRLEGHRDSTYDVAFSPDKRLLVSGGRDRTVRLWRLPKE